MGKKRVSLGIIVLVFKGGGMQKWECTVCGWIYDPAKGDPSQGIKPGTPFEDLPEDWVCPECGAPKDMFQPL